MRRSLFAALVWSLVASPLNAQAVDRSLILEEFDIPTDGDAMVVPVKVGDRDCRFVVDTGFHGTAFGTSLKPLLGRPLKEVRLQTPTGFRDRELFSCPEIRLGRLPVTIASHVCCLPMDGVEKGAVAAFQRFTRLFEGELYRGRV